MLTRILVLVLGLLLLVVIGAAGTALALLTYRVKGQCVDNGEVCLHFTDEGDGPPVILLHGFAVNADINWRRPGITKKLAQEYRVISLDLRGHGLSTKLYGMDSYGAQMVEDVVLLLDHLGIAKAHVVGYSLGGFIALKLAVDYPERLRTVTAMGSGWEHPDDGAFLSALPRLGDELMSGEPISPLSGYFGGEWEEPTLVHTLWIKLMTGFLNDPHALAGVVLSVPELAITENELRTISLPTCSIVASQDPLRPGAEAMVGRVANHRIVIIENADHLGALMRAKTLDTLREFLDLHR
jgi:pimeloyl-ACP methyl ester carboxylesterase